MYKDPNVEKREVVGSSTPESPRAVEGTKIEPFKKYQIR